jgi:hypothetical protein
VFWNAEASPAIAEDAAVPAVRHASTTLIRTALLGTALLSSALIGPIAAPDAARAAAWPCPPTAGWRVVRELELPRRDSADQPIGGFSAVHYDARRDQLLLLSDLPAGALLRWSGLAGGRTPRLEGRLPLLEPMDGEGLVMLDEQLWVASEGRRTAERPPQLLRFVAADGRLLEALPLPLAWQPAADQGLASNAGPESLALLPAAAGAAAPALLMAAEAPLLQDPPGVVRLLRWQWPSGADPRSSSPTASPAGSLQLPEGAGWGLTDLLVLEAGQLLALLRRFEPPFSWQIRLALYPLPQAASGAAAQASAEWDLLAAGLSPDNWEGLSAGPPLASGHPTLLLVSDDNLNPLQANRLALLEARGESRCRSQR